MTNAERTSELSQRGVGEPSFVGGYPRWTLNRSHFQDIPQVWQAGVSGRDTEMRTGAIGTMVTDSLHTGELTCGGSASFDPSQDPNPPRPTTRQEQPPPSSSVFLMSHPPEPPSPTPGGNTHLLRIPREQSAGPMSQIHSNIPTSPSLPTHPAMTPTALL